MLLFLHVRNNFDLKFLQDSAKNEPIFFSESFWEQIITCSLMRVHDTYGDYLITWYY